MKIDLVTAEDLERIGIATPYVHKIHDIVGDFPTLYLDVPSNLPVRDYRGKIYSQAFAARSTFRVIGTEKGTREPVLIVAKDYKDRDVVLTPIGHVKKLMKFGPPKLMEKIIAPEDTIEKTNESAELSGLAAMIAMRRKQAVVRL